MSLINAASGHAGQVITSYFNLQTSYELPISKMEKSSWIKLWNFTHRFVTLVLHSSVTA